MENSSTSETSSSTPRSGPGSMLQQARTALRLTPEDVAQILRLSPKQIMALERNEYRHLPGPTYIRGYLRSYAQLLGLPPDVVLESYAQLAVPPVSLDPPKSAPVAQVTSSHRVVQLTTALVVVLVLGLAALWWRGLNETPERVAISVPAVEQPPAMTEEPGVLRETPAVPAEGSGHESSMPVTNEPVPLTKPGIAGTRPSTQPLESTPATNGQMYESGMIVNVPPVDQGKLAPVRVNRSVVRSPDMPPGTTPSRLVLSASQDSWADIRDARENKLLYETIPAGRTISVEGLAPFSVFLGNVDGVKVEFNGQAYAAASHKRGQVARFTVGAPPETSN